MNGTVAQSLLAYPVYTGIWFNWSQGRIQGATLTLSHQNGGLLTAFLALFITVVASSFWRLFCFAAHFKLSAGKSPQDGLYHQRQAVFRNATTDIAGLLYFIRTAWAWRGRIPWRQRIVPLVCITVTMIIGFWAASIFSSQVSTTAGNEVLLSSPGCGNIGGWSFPTVNDYYRDFVRYRNEMAIASASYAQHCYCNGDDVKPQECHGYVKGDFPMAMSRNEGCPFPGGDKICLRNTGNFRIDTGIIDSHEDFGINSPPENRIGISFELKCAPLKTSLYTRKRASINGTSQEDVLEYLYGYSVSRSEEISLTNATYEYPTYSHPLLNEDTDFTIGIVRSDSGRSWYPIADLDSHDPSDVIFLVFVSANGLNFLQEVDDDLFSAHQLAPSLLNINGLREAHGSGKITVFHADQPANVLGCKTRCAFCNQSKDICRPITEEETWSSMSHELQFNERQNNTFGVLLTGYQGMETAVPSILNQPGWAALMARNSVSDNLVGPLLPNQWQKEVMHWQATSLAMLQRSVIEQFTGPSDSSAQKYVNRYANMSETDDQKGLCHSQKIRTTAYTSFSVLILTIIFVLGVFIIFLSVAAEPILRFTQDRGWHRYGVFQRLEWISNETLQLQRMAHEELGFGTWEGAAEAVGIPVTRHKETLAVLDWEDEERNKGREWPRLKKREEKRTTLLGQADSMDGDSSDDPQETYSQRRGRHDDPI